MGWRPRDVLETTVWRFWVAWSGFVEFHTPDSGPEPMTRNRLDQILREYDDHGRRT